MTPQREFEPKLVTVFREGYSRRQFAHDLAAGVQVGIWVRLTCPTDGNLIGVIFTQAEGVEDGDKETGAGIRNAVGG